MAFQISPGVNVSEVDLTTVVPSVLTTAGAFAGQFRWGPANQVKLIDSEITLTKTFGTPDANSGVSFFTAANFLSYGNNLSVVRAIDVNSKNSDSNTSTANILVENDDVFQSTYLLTDNQDLHGPFIGRFPGSVGNGIKVSVCDNATDFATWDYKGYFQSAPATSVHAEESGGSDDEMHIIVIDTTGNFGPVNAVLETYAFVSKASDATVNGESNYYKQVIFNKSKYIHSMGPVDYANTNSSWGHNSRTSFATLSGIQEYVLIGGATQAVSDGDLETAYDL